MTMETYYSVTEQTYTNVLNSYIFLFDTTKDNLSKSCNNIHFKKKCYSSLKKKQKMDKSMLRVGMVVSILIFHELVVYKDWLVFI